MRWWSTALAPAVALRCGPKRFRLWSGDDAITDVRERAAAVLEGTEQLLVASGTFALAWFELLAPFWADMALGALWVPPGVRGSSRLSRVTF